MNIAVITGSRADYGLLEWPIKVLQEDAHFAVAVCKIWGAGPAETFAAMELYLRESRPDLVLLLGDRYEIMQAALACHLQRVPIAHIGGGDVTEGSYDDAMRDSISRMASIHFVTSTSAMARLSHAGYRNVHLVGNPGVDYIRHAPWRGERPIAEPYVVVSYQAETIDLTTPIMPLLDSLTFDARHKVFMLPNPDLGSDGLGHTIKLFALDRTDVTVHAYLPHAEFLNLLVHCEEFIGNSSAMLYEAPELGIRTRMIGKRQRGRTIPWGDGQASQRMANILKYTSL